MITRLLEITVKTTTPRRFEEYFLSIIMIIMEIISVH